MRMSAALLPFCLTAGCLLASAQTRNLNATDKAFLKFAAEANMTEAHIGKVAEDQSSNSAVKDFGQKLVQDHTKAYDELTAVANKTGENIPKGIDIARNRAAEEVTREKGANFDRRFARYEVQDHQKAIAEFKREAEKGADPDVKAYAEKMIPELEQHLHEAQQLEKSGHQTASAMAHRQRP